MKRLVVLIFMTACSHQSEFVEDEGSDNNNETVVEESPDISKTDLRYTELRNDMFQLQMELSSIINSSYATCSSSLSVAVKNICEIAQASTVEARVEMLSALADLANQLSSRINDSGAQLSVLATSWRSIYGVDFPDTSGAPIPSENDCTTNSNGASILACISLYGSVISDIKSTVDAIEDSVQGAMLPVVVGEENSNAGPVYEQLLRLSDGSRVNAYANGLSTPLTTGSHPLQATSSSSNLIVNIFSHGLSLGMRVRVEGCSAGKGFTFQQLNNVFTISNTTINTFTISLPSNASSSGSFGGSSCIIRRYSGSGISEIWHSGDGSDMHIRGTSVGTVVYNFAICETSGGDGKICYHDSNPSASFMLFSAIPSWSTTCNSAGSIICK